MKNIAKKLFCLVVALLLLMALPLTARAETDPGIVRSYLFDKADVLEDTEETLILQSLQRYSTQRDLAIVIYAADSLNGDYIDDRAESLYDQNKHYFPYAGGVLLLVAMEEREWYIYTTGDAYDYLTDAALDEIEDAIVPLLSAGDYYNAFSSYVELCDKFLTMGQEGNPYRGSFPWGQNIVIALVVGLVVALIVVSSMKAKLKTVRPRREAHEYTRPGSMNVTRSRDLFLYRTVHRRPKPKDSSSGGRSGGGGGRSGGRGGSF